MRTPALGVVPPTGTVTVVIEKAITESEAPIVLTRQPQTLMIRAVHPHSVEVVNMTAMPVPYMLVVVPRFALRLASVPWARVAEALSSPAGRSAILEKLTQLFLGAGRQLDK
jgi:hypothetical protein